MRSVAKLKEQARAHEQKEEWDKAIRVYEQVLDVTRSAGEDLDLPLFNRIGDLHLRMGRQADAVRCYEEAADNYAEAGLFNNAIALCNKALRYHPERIDLYRKLGRLSVEQGFITDARRWFLEYAERQLKAGEEQAAFEALGEFAQLTDDPEARELLAEHLEAHGEEAEAVVQLRQAWVLRVRAGDDARAELLKERILTLDPDAELTVPDPLPTAAGDEDDDPLASSPLPGIDLQTAAGAAGIDAPGGEAPSPPPPPVEPAPEEAVPDGPVDAPVPEPDAEPEDPVEPLPLLDDAADVEEFGNIELGGFDDTEFDDADAAIEPVEPLPLLDFDAEPEPPPLPELPDVAAEAEPDDVLADARALADAGDRGAALRLLESRAAELSADALVGAAALVDELADVPGEEFRAHQLRVELAFRLADDQRLVRAYLELGAYLERAGQATKAAAVYERVLDLDAENAAARRALRGETSAAARRDESDGYVDLAALLGDDVIGSAAPTGTGSVSSDEDFALLLDQFRSQASAQVGTDNAAGHYDLGLAFKEMGLIDEAIAEFQTALEGGEEELKIYEELGQCYMQQAQYNVAASVLGRALQLPARDETELLGVCYHLGRCYEELGRRDDAREAYARVATTDAGFRDVAERLARL